MNVQLFLSFVLNIDPAAVEPAGKSCTTPGGERAQCVPLYNCTILYNAVTDENPDTLRFLRESHCGDKTEPYVCCGSSIGYKRDDSNRKVEGSNPVPVSAPKSTDKNYSSKRNTTELDRNSNKRENSSEQNTQDGLKLDQNKENKPQEGLNDSAMSSSGSIQQKNFPQEKEDRLGVIKDKDEDSDSDQKYDGQKEIDNKDKQEVGDQKKERDEHEKDESGDDHKEEDGDHKEKDDHIEKDNFDKEEDDDYEGNDSDLKEGDSCVTPNKENGICLKFKDCAPIFAAISTFNTEAIKFARESQCGSDLGVVCCGSLGNSTSSEVEEISLSDFSNPTVCGLDALPPYKIKGGTIAQLEEFPWMAALEYTDSDIGDFFFCGGSLISDRYVLTAANCIILKYELTKVWLGATNISSDFNCLKFMGHLECPDSIQKVNIEKKITHPLFSSTSGRNNIGLLRLETRIKFTDYIRPICLPSPDSPSPHIGTIMTIAGWGYTENDAVNGVKMKAEVPVQNSSFCKKYFDDFTSEQLCVGGKTQKNLCSLYYGIPLMKDFRNANDEIQWYQEGLFSHSLLCNYDGEYSTVHIKLYGYVAWIINETSEDEDNDGSDKEDERKKKDETHKVKENDLKVKDDDLDHKEEVDDHEEVVSERPCTTPNGETATCKELTDCDVLLQAVASKDPNLTIFLRASSCGNLMVCCGTVANFTTPTPKMKSPENINTTKSESHHKYDTKNILLSKQYCGLQSYDDMHEEIETLTVRNAFPWLVYIPLYNLTDQGSNKTVELMCTGVIISRQYALTAVECNLPFDRVRIGQYDKFKNFAYRELEFIEYRDDAFVTVKIEEKIKSNYGILLLRFAKQVHFTEYIRPICLPLDEADKPKVGDELISSGWSHVPIELLNVTAKKIVKHVLSEPYFLIFVNNVNYTDCVGDEGGPLMHRKKVDGRNWILDAIVPPFFCLNKPARKLNEETIDWILANIRS